MSDSRVLVVEDEPAQRALLSGFLRDVGYRIEEAADGEEARRRVRHGGIDVVLLDQRMPGLSGEDAIRALREADPELEIVVVTAFASVDAAVAALKLGASDYMTKPLDLDRLQVILRKSLERRRLLHEVRELREKLAGGPRFQGIVAASGAMHEILSALARAAPTEATVLLTGESGTGKELLARALHAASRRASGPFVAVHSAALAPGVLESELFGHERGAFTGADRARVGRFEAAAGGTVFLDEVSEIPPSAQVKLLRVLQERVIERVGSQRAVPIDVRIVAATHRDLEGEILAGRFREDLFYRLAVVRLHVPPLRERKDDIPRLIDHFLAKHSGAGAHRVVAPSREAMDLLLRHEWPGNVRELENVVQSAVVLARGEILITDDLPASLRVRADAEGAAGPRKPGSLPGEVEALERRLIEEALRATDGVQYRAAERLGISERTLRYKIEKLRLR